VRLLHHAAGDVALLLALLLRHQLALAAGDHAAAFLAHRLADRVGDVLDTVLALQVHHRAAHHRPVRLPHPPGGGVAQLLVDDRRHGPFERAVDDVGVVPGDPGLAAHGADFLPRAPRLLALPVTGALHRIGDAAAGDVGRGAGARAELPRSGQM